MIHFLEAIIKNEMGSGRGSRTSVLLGILRTLGLPVSQGVAFAAMTLSYAWKHNA
jgi:hypothetical protein